MALTERSNYFWILIGLLITVVFGLITIRYLGWIVFSIFMYYLSRPIRTRLEKHIDSKTLSAFLSLFLIALPILLILATFLISVLAQLNVFLGTETGQNIVSTLPQTLNLSNINEAINSLEQGLTDPNVQNLIDSTLGIIGSFAASSYNLFISLILVFYLLKEDQRLFNWINTNFLKEKGLIKEYFQRIDEGLNSVYFGYTLTIFAVIILTLIIYTVFNLLSPQGLTIPLVAVLALLTGVFTLVPLVGRSVVYLGITLYLSYQATQQNPNLLWYPVVFFLFMSIAFDNLIRIYIRPYLSGKQFETSLVMFAYLIGPQLFGWYGIFLGPLIMVTTVTFLKNTLPQLK